jgi:hypothetical protein
VLVNQDAIDVTQAHALLERPMGDAAGPAVPDLTITGEPVGPLAELLSPGSELPGTEVVLGDFWQWAYSDVLSNATRGTFGEYLVATALEAATQPRIEWDGADLFYRDRRIEVKTSSWHQAWPRPENVHPSPPQFGIAPHLVWDPYTGQNVSPVPSRPAHVYVFCHYVGPIPYPDTNRERRIAVLDTANWQFHVAARTLVEERFGAHYHVTLERLTQVIPSVGYRRLKAEVDVALNQFDGHGTALAPAEGTATERGPI